MTEFVVVYFFLPRKGGQRINKAYGPMTADAADEMYANLREVPNPGKGSTFVGAARLVRTSGTTIPHEEHALTAMTAAGDPRWWRDRAEKLERQLTAASDTTEALRADLTDMTAKAETYQRMYYAEHGQIAAELTAAQERIGELTAKLDNAHTIGWQLSADLSAETTRAQRAEERVATERKQAAAQAWDEGWDARDDNDPNGQVFTQRDCADGDEINPYRSIDLTAPNAGPCLEFDCGLSWAHTEGECRD